MDNKILSFNQKLQLYKDLKKYFKFSKGELSKIDIESIKDRLERWGKELRIRQNYYDL